MTINTYFKNIADAIREKTGDTGLITPGNMPDEILNISGGGGWVTPLHTNFKNGFIDGNTYYKQYNANLNASIYQIDISENTYFFCMNSNNTNRFRVAQFPTDPFIATTHLTNGRSLVTQSTVAYPYHVAIVNAYPGYPYIFIDVGNTENSLNSLILCSKCVDMFEE